MEQKSFWRKEDPVLNEEGRVIKGGMWEHQRRFWESKAFIKALVTGYGGGKAQPLDSQIMTPSGYKKLKDLWEGDIISDPTTGGGQRVLKIFPQGIKKVYRVTFSDRTSTECCGEHLWNVQDKVDRTYKSNKFVTKELQEFSGNLTAPDGTDVYTIPLTTKLLFNETESILEKSGIPPYLLAGLILSPELQRFVLKIKTGQYPMILHLNTLVKPMGYSITRNGDFFGNGNGYLEKKLVELNISNVELPDRTLPDFVVYSSIEDRILFLKGLMDFSGTVTEGKNVIFCTPSKKIAEQIKFIVQSLGGVVYKTLENFSMRRHHYFYDVFLTLPKDIVPFFRNEVALSLWDKYRDLNKIPIKYIRSVEYIGDKECACILVSGKDHLYMTNDCIVTHNTLIGSKRGISLALHNAPSPHIAVSPSYKMAKKTTIPTIKELLAGKKKNLVDFKWKFNKTDNEFKIYYKNREATIWVVSGDDPDSLKGPNAGSVSIDEPFVQSRAVFDQMLARVRDPRAKTRELILTGTPEDLNWGYDICEGDEKENFDIEVIQASTRENKALDCIGYADRLENAYSEQAALSYVDGKFVSMSKGLVYYAFNPSENVISLPDLGLPLHVGMDFNVNPMAATVFWMNNEHCHIIGVIEIPNSDTKYMCQVLCERYPSRIATVVPDASGKSRSTKAPGGKSDFHYIDEAATLYGGFHRTGRPQNPSIRDRENAVNGKLKPRNGPPTLTMEPSCKSLIKYFKQYAHEKRHLPEQKAMSHLLDATGYPIEFYFPVRGNNNTLEIVGV